MNVIRLRRDTDASKTANESPGMNPDAAPLRTGDQADKATIDPQGADDVRSDIVETVVRWCAMGVALTLAAFLGVWLLK